MNLNTYGFSENIIPVWIPDSLFNVASSLQLAMILRLCPFGNHLAFSSRIRFIEVMLILKFVIPSASSYMKIDVII